MLSLSVSLLALVAVTCVSDAVGSGVDLQSSGPNQWFSSELYLLNDQDNEREQPQQPQSYQENRRYKRSYGGSYQSKGYEYGSGNYGSNSYGKLNQGYENGARLGLKCLALSSTATNQWCYDNCLQGHCPRHVCSCSGEVYSRAVKNSYGSHSKLGKYGQWSYSGQPKYNYGQSSYVRPSYGQVGSIGGYQKTSYQGAHQIEPRHQQFEQQKIQY